MVYMHMGDLLKVPVRKGLLSGNTLTLPETEIRIRREPNVWPSGGEAF